MGAGGSTYFWLGASADAETGSREPDLSSTGSGPTGFDPARKCERCDGFGEYLVPADTDEEAWARCIWCHGRGYACNACDPV